MSNIRKVLSSKENVVFNQLENESINYTVNWANRIGTNTITISDWILGENNGLTIISPAIIGSNVIVRLGGNIGQNNIVNKVTLSNGEIMEFSFLLNILSNKSNSHIQYYNCHY